MGSLWVTCHSKRFRLTELVDAHARDTVTPSIQQEMFCLVSSAHVTCHPPDESWKLSKKDQFFVTITLDPSTYGVAFYLPERIGSRGASRTLINDYSSCLPTTSVRGTWLVEGTI